MNRSKTDRLPQALSNILREVLTQDEQLHLPELGTFQVEHHLSEVKELENGRIVMTPPQDAIVFIPAKTLKPLS